MKFRYLLFLYIFFIISCKKSESVTPSVNPVIKADTIKKSGLYFYMKLDDREIYYQDSLLDYRNIRGGTSTVGRPFMAGPGSSFCTSSGVNNRAGIFFFKQCDSLDAIKGNFLYPFSTGEYKYANIQKSLGGPSIVWEDNDYNQWSTDDIFSNNRDQEKFVITAVDSTEDPNVKIISGNFTANLYGCAGVPKKAKGDFRIKISQRSI